MTEGSDGKTIDGMSFNSDCWFDWLTPKGDISAKTCKTGVYFKEKRENATVRGPSFDDKLVQKVTRMILEAIYEGQFQDCSHGFRSNAFYDW